MSARTVTTLAIVVAMLVIGGTALAIGGQLGAPQPATGQAADSPDIAEATTTSTPVSSAFPALVLPEPFDPFDEVALPTAAAPSTSTTAITAVPTTTITRSITTWTTPAPASTTNAAPTTTVAPTTTTVAPTTTTVAPAPTTTTAPAGGTFSASSESQFVSLINGVRADLGLPALTVSSSLNSYARDWTFHMADTNTFAHSNIGSLLGSWTRVGENIAYGWSVGSMHNALVASPGHYANLTSSDFTHIGVGVWIEDGGKIWTAHTFGG